MAALPSGIRIFGIVDGFTNRRWDAAVWLIPPFDWIGVNGPYQMKEADIQNAGFDSDTGQIVETDFSEE